MSNAASKNTPHQLTSVKLTSVKRNAATLAAAAVLVEHCKYAAAKGAGYVCEHCSRGCERDSFTECHLSF